MAAIEDSQTQTVRQYPVGRPLVEVFWVRIDNIDGADPGQLYGNIMVADGLSTQYLYNRDKSNYQSIKPGENVQLIGPPRVISAADHFLIELSLYDPKDEICKGEISWNVYDPFKKYDEVHNLQIIGQYGAATINYIVLRDASEAYLIEVVLITRDGENPAKVYGSLKASNGFGESQLFKRSADDYVDVRPGHPIPLLRTSMAVPRTHDLVIDVDLWDYDPISSDVQIAKGLASFVPLVNTSTKSLSITGTYGEIEVRIT